MLTHLSIFSAKFVPIDGGMRKLQVMCAVEDKKVSLDLLVEEIKDMKEFVEHVGFSIWL